MKKSIGCFIMFTLCLMIVFVGCFGNDDDDTVPGSTVFVTFTVNGVAKSFNYGFTDKSPTTAIMGWDTTNSTLYAYPSAVVSSAAGNSPDYLWIQFSGKTTDTQTPTFINYRESSTTYSLTDLRTITVTKYEDAGGYAEGTFSGSGSGKTITNGTFKVTTVNE